MCDTWLWYRYDLFLRKKIGLYARRVWRFGRHGIRRSSLWHVHIQAISSKGIFYENLWLGSCSVILFGEYYAPVNIACEPRYGHSRLCLCVCGKSRHHPRVAVCHYADGRPGSSVVSQGRGGDSVCSFDVDYKFWWCDIVGVGVFVYGDVWRHVQQLYKLVEISIIMSCV